MASCENKYITLLDLSRQAKVITGETACFDGKIQAGIPFSGYPTGVDTGTTVSLGFVSGETAVFSGNTGTTVFDVSNSGSTNYNSLFSGYSGTVWTNVLYSGNTSGLTLPITPLSADSQVVGPVWTLTQTATTSNGEHIIDIQYTGYSITYSFNQIEQLPFSGYTAYSGFCSANQENFSAGTLDYKGPLDYISTKEDATVEGILTTKKLTVTDGASASTIGYVLTQLDSSGRAGWVFNSASASTNTFVTGGTLNGTNLDLTWNTGGSVPSIDFSSLSGETFTGNTSGDCITDLYLTNLYGCSPLHIEPSGVNNVYIVENGGNVGIGTTGTTEKLHVSGGDILVEGSNGKFYTDLSNSVFRFSAGTSDLTTLGISTPSSGSLLIGTRGSTEPSFPGYGKQGDGFLYSSAEQNGLNIISQQGTSKDDYIRFYVGQSSGAVPANTPDIHIQGSGVTRGNVGINTKTPTEKLHIEGSIRMVDGNESNGYVLTSDANGVGSWAASAGGTFTGNTSGDCITDLYLTNLYGCSPITVHDTITYNGSIIDSATTNSFIFGDSHVLTGDTGSIHGVDYDSNVLLGGSDNRISLFQIGKYNTIAGGSGNFIDGRSLSNFILGSTDSNISGVFASGSAILSGNLNEIVGSPSCVIVGGDSNGISGNSVNSIVIGGTNNSLTSTDNSIILGGQNITGSTSDTVYVPILNINNIVSGGTSVNNLGIDVNGNVVTGTAGGGGTDVTTAATTTIDFSGLTYHYDSVTPATGNITENLTGAKLGLIQKIYHNDVSEPTYPSGWVLMGDAIYFTSTLNIIYAEWAGGTRVEYWYVQEQ